MASRNPFNHFSKGEIFFFRPLTYEVQSYRALIQFKDTLLTDICKNKHFKMIESMLYPLDFLYISFDLSYLFLVIIIGQIFNSPGQGLLLYIGEVLLCSFVFLWKTRTGGLMYRHSINGIIMMKISVKVR